MKKKKALVCGVGINDADYVVKEYVYVVVNGKKKQKLVWECPYYSTWTCMLQRCYYSKCQEKYPTYKGCSVSEEWLTFSNFKRWMEKQDWEGLQLDKDLLVEGNKVYSPETCVFISGMLNRFFISSDASRGKYMLGVYWNKETGKFKSQCRNPFTKKNEHLGYFDTELEAHLAWKEKKNELAQRYATKQTDERVIEALLTRFKP